MGNDVVFPVLASSVFHPRDVARTMLAIANGLGDSGTVWVNDHLPLASETPHGGFKQSGFGIRICPPRRSVITWSRNM